MAYYFNYPKEPIGRGNPYSCCSYCKTSDPEINGELEGHPEWCEWRQKKELELKFESLNDLAAMMAQSLSSSTDSEDKALVDLYNNGDF